MISRCFTYSATSSRRRSCKLGAPWRWTIPCGWRPKCPKLGGLLFLDLGDQFLALQKGRKQPDDDGRHFGLVVDDKEVVRAALVAAGVSILPGRFLDFLDPWGNRIEIVGYENIQFTKAPHVLRGMGLTDLAKTPQAIKELADKGMGPD